MPTKRCLDAAIAKYKDTDPYDLSDLSHDSAWEEAMTRIQDDPQKNFITIIDIARAGKATKDMVDYIREKQIVKNALSLNQNGRQNRCIGKAESYNGQS